MLIRLMILLLCAAFAQGCIPRTGKIASSSTPLPSPSIVKETPSQKASSKNSNREMEESVTSASVLAGRVVGVPDGDTITVLDNKNVQNKIRLSGIDAPESCQDFGRVAKKRMSDLVFGKNVTVFHDKVDRYGRIVGKVIVDGRDANLTMIEDGLAWHFKRYQNEQSQEDRVIYSEAEESARQDNKGLWLQPNAIAPWDFRTVNKCGNGS